MNWPKLNNELEFFDPTLIDQLAQTEVLHHSIGGPDPMRALYSGCKRFVDDRNFFQRILVDSVPKQE